MSLSFQRNPHRFPGESPAAAPADEQAEAQASPEAEANPEAEPANGDNPEALKVALLKAVEERTRRAESSVVRSMADQHALPEAALAEMLASARAAQAEALPPEAQARLDALNADLTRRLTLAEVKSVGAEIGLIDPDVAMTFLDTSALTIGEDGTVTGVREALESLRQRKGYLFAPPARGAWAQRVSAGGAAQLSGVEEAFYRKNPALRR